MKQRLPGSEAVFNCVHVFRLKNFDTWPGVDVFVDVVNVVNELGVDDRRDRYVRRWVSRLEGALARQLVRADLFGVPVVVAVHDNIRESVDGVGGIHLAVVLGRCGLAKQAVTAVISLHKKKVQSFDSSKQ